MKKFAYLMAAFLLIASIVLTSCGTTEKTTSSTTTTTTSTSTAPPTTTTVSPETPKYGGTITHRLSMEPMGFDDCIGLHQSGISSGFLTQEELFQGDWAKGPAGTGETDWTYGFIGRIALETGALAESWEFPDSNTVVWHIREGVHWQNKAPTSGREYTSADAVFNLTRWINTPNSWMYINYVPQGYAPTSVTAIDKYTVEAKIPSILFGQMFITMSDFGIFHYPPEAVAKYGNMSDWRNACGTGPWMLTDYVSGSSLTYVRNPNYWMTDPMHRENQLPYAESVKQLIIVDPSTALAALRTGKLDAMDAISWENTQTLLRTNPELKYLTVVNAPFMPAGRMDKPELPFQNIKVRQALNMAINKQALVDDYYDGHAYLLGYPYPPTKTYEKIYTPLNEQSQEVQDLFKYDPDRAIELLAEAGYPTGFTTTIDCEPTMVDLLSIVREDLLKVGVDMKINQMEIGVFNSLNRARGHKEMIMKGGVDYSFPWRMMMVRIESMDNPAFIDTPTFRAAYEKMAQNIGKNDDVVNQTLKEISQYSLGLAWAIWMPAYDVATVWQPWLQNYHGENQVGYFNPYYWYKYVWVDQVLKKSMGH